MDRAARPMGGSCVDGCPVDSEPMTTGLAFRLFRIPFRVQWWFFATLVLVNLDRLRPFSTGPLQTLISFAQGVAIAAAVVIAHELGHCLAYRRYGLEPSVLLWGLGGLTFGGGRL